MTALSLAQFRTDQIPELLSWVKAREALRMWSGTYFSYPITQQQIADHLHRLDAAPHRSLAYSGASENGVMVAFGEICEIRPGESAMLRKIIIRPDSSRRQGYGTTFVRELLSIAFTEHHVHRVYLGVFNDNHAAISLYLKLGFVDEGSWREHVKDGDTFHTLNWMSLLQPEWEQHLRVS